MTEHEMAELEQGVDAWEALERAAGLNPDDLDYPADLGERIEEMRDETDWSAVIMEFEDAERPDTCDCHPDGQPLPRRLRK